MLGNQERTGNHLAVSTLVLDVLHMDRAVWLHSV